MPSAAKRVTALRERAGGNVVVELDGEKWRVLPADAVVRAGVRVGVALERPLARELARALRRSRALDVATRALRHRDLAREEIVARLARSGVGAAAETELLETLERTGLVDDGRFAVARAAALAARGYGDAAARADLERRGVSAEAIKEALAALEPELVRARALAARDGPGTALARRLAARGFGEEAVEAAIGAVVADEDDSE